MAFGIFSAGACMCEQGHLGFLRSADMPSLDTLLIDKDSSFLE